MIRKVQLACLNDLDINFSDYALYYGNTEIYIYIYIYYKYRDQIKGTLRLQDVRNNDPILSLYGGLYK